MRPPRSATSYTGSRRYHPAAMGLSSRFFAGAALAATVCWVLALGLLDSTEALLFMAPALLLAAPLLAGRYVGESLIERLASRHERPRRRLAASSLSPPRLGVLTLAPRGTRLIAFSLAKRPPPGLLLPQS